jgi:hypothetical protein
MNRRRLVLAGAAVLIGLLVSALMTELILSEVYFRAHAPYYSSTEYYWSALRAAVFSVLPEQRIGIWKHDAVYGFSHIPSARGVHGTVDFKVSYTIGPEQERYVPAPPQPRGRVVFLGDSMTFGHGVNDDEPYPYLLSRHWTDLRIVNKAVMGWGTAHAYLALSEELSSASQVPLRLVVCINSAPHSA